MEISKKIGKNLQVIVNQWFKTQKNFAQFFNVSPQSASTWISGSTQTPLDVLLSLEKITGFTVMQICTATIIINQETQEYQILTDTDTMEKIPILTDSANPQLEKKLDDLTEIKEKVEMLWKTNLHRAEKMEEWEFEQKSMKEEIARLRAEIVSLKAGKT